MVAVLKIRSWLWRCASHRQTKIASNNDHGALREVSLRGIGDVVFPVFHTKGATASQFARADEASESAGTDEEKAAKTDASCVAAATIMIQLTDALAFAALRRCIIITGIVMETKDFENFVASQQEPGDTAKDLEETREGWLKDLDSLHRKVADFLQDFVKAGSISYNFVEMELTEPALGTYLAKRMDIKIGRQRVSLVPVGTMLIGCKGRVDAQGSTGRAQILLVDEKAKSPADLIKVTVNVKGEVPLSPSAREPRSWAWKILSNALQWRFVDLDKKSFFELLVEVGNG